MKGPHIAPAGLRVLHVFPVAQLQHVAAGGAAIEGQTAFISIK